jgi:hypothetical protein
MQLNERADRFLAEENLGAKEQQKRQLEHGRLMENYEQKKRLYEEQKARTEALSIAQRSATPVLNDRFSKTDSSKDQRSTVRAATVGVGGGTSAGVVTTSTGSRLPSWQR